MYCSIDKYYGKLAGVSLDISNCKIMNKYVVIAPQNYKIQIHIINKVEDFLNKILTTNRESQSPVDCEKATRKYTCSVFDLL